MKDIKLRLYQIQAIEAIQAALDRGQKKMAIEMPTGCGKGIVYAKTVDKLNELCLGKILVVTSRVALKEQIEKEIFTSYQDFLHISQDNIIVETVQRVVRHYQEKIREYPIIIFYDYKIPHKVYEMFPWDEKIIIAFCTINSENLHNSMEVVFSYSFKDAVNDGFLTPAMDTRALVPAFEVFTKRLLEQFGYINSSNKPNEQEQRWDVVAEKHNQKIWAECKVYKSQVVSPSAANSMLQTQVFKRI